MIQRIREVFSPEQVKLDGTIEIDETCIGGKEKNKPASRSSMRVAGR